MSDRDFIIQEIRKLFKEKIDKKDMDQRIDRAREVYKIITKKDPPADVEIAGGGDNMVISKQIVPKEFIPYILGQVNSLPAEKDTKTQTKDDKAFVGPSQQKTSKVIPAKKTQSAEDFPFQVANLPDKFPNKIVAGMDRSDPGYDKGGSKAINQAAIGILGSDPKVIYTALINSGVLPPNYSPSGEPFSDLPKHIATFQDRAINGLLRYQKQMKISAKDADSRLRYEPKAPTPSLRKNLSDKERAIAMKPGLTEQQKANVAVDGKIGSRTAKMLLVYADKSKFDSLKTKAGVKPKSEPSPVKGVPAPTSTSSGKTTKKPEKKSNNCSIDTFININDLKAKTILTLMGYDSCSLKAKKNVGEAKLPNWTDLGNTMLGAAGSEGLDAFLPRYKARKEMIKKDLSTTRGQVDIYNQITTKADLGKQVPVSERPYAKMERFMNKAVSGAIFSFHAGHMWNKMVIDFAFIKSRSANIPLIYKSSHLSGGALQSYMKAVNYNTWIVTPLKQRKNTFEKPINLQPLKNNLNKHLQRLEYFYKNGIMGAKRAGEFSSGEGQDTLLKAGRMIMTYQRNLKNFIQNLAAFESDPSSENLDKLISSGAIPSLTQKILHNQQGATRS